MQQRPATLAALASIPGRAHLLPKALESLRPQVDRIHVYLNGYDSVPECVEHLADEHVLSPENQGAERKLHWSQSFDGVYLTCDDDFIYPEDYVCTMVDAVLRWSSKAIVTAHGRTYKPTARMVHHVVPESLGTLYMDVPHGRFVNHGGTGVMAWDARRIHVPNTFPARNMADMQVAIWAQMNRVPIWLIPHKKDWLTSLAPLDPKGIFRSSQAEGHARRNRLLRQYAWQHGWKLYVV